MVRRFWQGWNKGNIEEMMALVSDKVINHDQLPGLPNDKEGVDQQIGVYFKTFPGVQVEVEDLIAEGDKVVCRLTFIGTNTGPFMEIPVTGKNTTVTAISIFRVTNGKP